MFKVHKLNAGSPSKGYAEALEAILEWVRVDKEWADDIASISFEREAPNKYHVTVVFNTDVEMNNA